MTDYIYKLDPDKKLFNSDREKHRLVGRFAPTLKEISALSPPTFAAELEISFVATYKYTFRECCFVITARHTTLFNKLLDSCSWEK